MNKHAHDDKFTSPAANFWGILANDIDRYRVARSKLAFQGIVYQGGEGVRALRSTEQKEVVPVLGQGASALRACQQQQVVSGASFSELFQNGLAPFVKKTLKMSGNLCVMVVLVLLLICQNIS